jgi:glycosidase
MLNVTRHWLRDMHGDGFRFDAIPYLVEDGNQLNHTRATHDVLRRFGSDIRSLAPESFTIGEMSDESPQTLATYYPDQLDAYFAFGVAFATVEAAKTGKAQGFIKAVIDANAMLPPGRWMPFLTNHDHVRVMTQLGGNAGKARVAASAMLLLPGMPFVYYGEEIGMVGTKPDEMLRNPMQWSAGPNGGFTSGVPWEGLQADWKTKNVAAQDRDAGSLLNHYRSLIRLRNSHPALNAGSLAMAATDDRNGETAGWVRLGAGERMIVVVNFGDRVIDQLKVELDGPFRELRTLYADPLGGCSTAGISGEGKTVTVSEVKANGICVLELRA